MINSNKTSRRSFLKQSSFGVAVAATSPLFALLPSANATYQGPPAPGQDPCVTRKYADFSSSGCGYATELEAFQDAVAVMTAWLNAGPDYVEVSVPIPPLYCRLRDLPLQAYTVPEQPFPIITQDGPNNYSYEFSFRQEVVVCDLG